MAFTKCRLSSVKCSFIPLHVDIYLSQHHLLKRWSLIHGVFWEPFQKLVDYVCEGFRPALPFYSVLLIHVLVFYASTIWFWGKSESDRAILFRLACSYEAPGDLVKLWIKFGEGLSSEANTATVPPNSFWVARGPRDLEDVTMQKREA